jgi:hypothetical protein
MKTNTLLDHLLSSSSKAIKKSNCAFIVNIFVYRFNGSIVGFVPLQYSHASIFLDVKFSVVNKSFYNRRFYEAILIYRVIDLSAP